MALGNLIVFEGPDSCGKSTQISLLCKYLAQKDKYYRIFKFPRYNTMYGKMIKNMLYNKDDFNILHNVKDMNTFSYLQIQDKLDGIKSIFEALETNNYVILDRYTLSSRIYDAAIRFCLNNDLKVGDVPKFNDDNNDALNTFLNDWIFSSEYRESHYKALFEDAFSVLENPLLNVYHVLFKSCPMIEYITRAKRVLDSYEEESTIKKLVTWTYDNISNIYNLENRHHFFKRDRYITVDTTRLVNDFQGIETQFDVCSNIINNYIVKELFGIMKNE
jgi:hypothetical protein